jgi:hypothetical protein
VRRRWKIGKTIAKAVRNQRVPACPQAIRCARGETRGRQEAKAIGEGAALRKGVQEPQARLRH